MSKYFGVMTKRETIEPDSVLDTLMTELAGNYCAAAEAQIDEDEESSEHHHARTRRTLTVLGPSRAMTVLSLVAQLLARVVVAQTREIERLTKGGA